MEPGPAAIREEGENRTARALLRLADSYIRWKTPEEAVRYPDRVPAQVMDIGTFGDCRSMRAVFGDGGLDGLAEEDCRALVGAAVGAAGRPILDAPLLR